MIEFLLGAGIGAFIMYVVIGFFVGMVVALVVEFLGG